MYIKNTYIHTRIYKKLNHLIFIWEYYLLCSCCKQKELPHTVTFSGTEFFPFKNNYKYT